MKTQPTNSKEASNLTLSNITFPISSLDAVVKAQGHDTLGSVLPLVNTSHSPLFVFTKDNEFIGLVSPYQALYSHSYPYSTKVSSIAWMPPYLTNDSPLFDVATFMLEKRVYVLPIFNDNKQLKGVIHAEDIFNYLAKSKALLTRIISTIKPHQPITADTGVTVGEVLQIIKDKHVSRVILVDEDKKLAGIVTRKDLLNAYMMPTQKQRFGKNGIAPTNWAFDEEKEHRKDDPIINYTTENVFANSDQIAQEILVKNLLTSKHNSIVLINKFKKPVGYLSMRDILVGLASLRPQEKINLIFSKPSSNVSDKEIKQAEEILMRFGNKQNKRDPIDMIEVTVEEPKTSEGGSIIFNTTAIVTPVSGAKIIAETKNRFYVDGIRSAIEQIKKQIRRRE
jgi:CBS domain-containing protein